MILNERKREREREKKREKLSETINKRHKATLHRSIRLIRGFTRVLSAYALESWNTGGGWYSWAGRQSWCRGKTLFQERNLTPMVRNKRCWIS